MVVIKTENSAQSVPLRDRKRVSGRTKVQSVGRQQLTPVGWGGKQDGKRDFSSGKIKIKL